MRTYIFVTYTFFAYIIKFRKHIFYVFEIGYILNSF